MKISTSAEAAMQPLPSFRRQPENYLRNPLRAFLIDRLAIIPEGSQLRDDIF
jgi:hypothetical protein